VNETTRRQDGRGVFLPPTPLALALSDSPSRREVTTRLVLVLVISRLDYCNYVLAGLPLCTIEPLQRVQYAAARLIFELSPSEHTTHYTKPILQGHWLPIR